MNLFYTEIHKKGMTMANIKTALSIPENTFKEVDALAREMKISRSRVYVLAVEEFIERRQNRKLIEKINAAHADGPDPNEARRLHQTLRTHRQIVENEW
jgi:metal-responsive CopG/Arc/MetJ family transcriptional regulator